MAAPTPPAEAQVVGGGVVEELRKVVSLWAAGMKEIGATKEETDAAIAALSAQPRPVETVDAEAWREALELPDGFEVVEFLPGIWQYEYDDDGSRMASGASWNHPAIAAIAAWQSAHQPQPASSPVGVEVPLVQQTAPERVWLAVSDDPHHSDEPFPPPHEDLCWSSDAPVAVCVPYVRADLAQQPAAVDGAIPIPRNRTEAAATAKVVLAYLGVIDAHIEAAIARCETNDQPQGEG